MPRVLICDELPVVRNGLRMMLSAGDGITVIDSTDSGAHAVMLARSHRPDVIITGLSLRGTSGLELMSRLRRDNLQPTAQFVVYTMNYADEIISEILHAGVSCVVGPESDAEDLTSAVRIAARGEVMLPPRVARRLVDWFRRRNTQPEETLRPIAAALTTRERQVLVLIATGLSTEQVADRLAIGIATVRTHVYRMRSKLQLTDRAQLVSFAYRAGLMQT
ncbi:response regulator transcription factor [Micromonospora ureilytica]|nr:response regulator transcription factor [Micromonospora ureilytica]WSR57106.1 response regulator transcription factor [Micromonospora ureilytica]